MIPKPATPGYFEQEEEFIEMVGADIITELKEVQEAGVVNADEQPYNAAVKCKEYELGQATNTLNFESRYSGQWKNKMPNGKGSLIVDWKDKKSGQLTHYTRYDGMWKNGKMCGRGRLLFTLADSKNRTDAWIRMYEGDFDEHGELAIGSSLG